MIVTTARGDVNVLDIGTGRTVVLLHPLAMAGELWRPVMASTPGLRFIAPDARGHGSTPWDGRPFTMEDMAADAAAVIEALDIAPAGVAGMSMGGGAAMLLAASRPELVSSLVLVDTTACYGDDRVSAWEARASKALSTQRDRQLPFQIDRWFSPSTIESDPATIKRVSDVFLATDSQAHAAACRAMGALDATPVLAKITAPTLVVVGAEDYATPQAMAAQLHAGISGSRLEIVEHARHLSVFDNPRAWALISEHFRST